MTWYCVSPAHGRDYHSPKEVLSAWLDGEDFRLDAPRTTYVSCRDTKPGDTVELHFSGGRRFTVHQVLTGEMT